MKIRWLHLFK